MNFELCHLWVGEMKMRTEAREKIYLIDQRINNVIDNLIPTCFQLFFRLVMVRYVIFWRKTSLSIEVINYYE